MNKLQIYRIRISFGLLLACAALAGCGDEKDPRLSDTDVACLKYIQAGLACNTNTNTTTATSTATATSTVTVTNTTTVN